MKKQQKTDYFESTTKPSLFQRVPVFLKTLFMGSKANFLNPRNTATSCSECTYSNLHPQTNKKSKPNPNPKQTQSKPISTRSLQPYFHDLNSGFTFLPCIWSVLAEGLSDLLTSQPASPASRLRPKSAFDPTGFTDNLLRLRGDEDLLTLPCYTRL